MPISMTSVISKIMESIIPDAIVVHLIKNEILSDDQHGFVPGRDWMTQLLLCMEEWTSMVEEGKNFDIIYTDFSKAFDSVAHERLLRKLENVGLNGHLLHWIRTFLTWVHFCLSSSLTICLTKSNIIYVNFLQTIVNCMVLLMMTGTTQCKSI